ncbi:MAG: glycosyltransferase [Thermoleophilia bacterium]|nr:glycosyltransferase [Thermoleophilia bacterium]
MLPLPEVTPATLQYVLLSFEGPDQYSTAGGLGVRVRELGLELARQGFTTHLIFIGDPNLPERSQLHDNFTVHRWCQWLSAHYREGVYHGEEAKLVDWNASLPGFVANELVRPAAEKGRLTAVLAEEWHTAASTCLLSDHLWAAGIRDRAIILWNANNIMGFDRVDWPPPGLLQPDHNRVPLHEAHHVGPRRQSHGHTQRHPGRANLQSPGVGRQTAQAGGGSRAAALQDRPLEPRQTLEHGHGITGSREAPRKGHHHGDPGGIEPHAVEVLHNAHMRGLKIQDVRLPSDPQKAVPALAELPRADIYNVQTFMSDELISQFYSAADAVLANSGHEPFGLVGLEVMAAGGVAFVGSTGEDYAVPYLNAVVLDTDDPAEISIALQYLREHPGVATRIRKEAQETARSFAWSTVIEDALITRLKYVALRQDIQEPSAAAGRLDPGVSAPYEGEAAGPQSVEPGGPRQP